MSDDEYYADSPYDEFEEMLWDADPAPHLADDLAQHTAYSPVWQDDPVGELEPYYSDWEYYSDDYFDDDPQILKKNPLDGSPPHKNITGRAQTKRGRKRKINEAFDTVDSAEKASLLRSIQGTVWAENTTPKIKTLQNGEQEKVALLIDWRERFKFDAKTRLVSKREQIQRDESWANELGLADMGLTYVRESKSTQDDTELTGSDADEDPGDEALGDGNHSDLNEEGFNGASVATPSQQDSTDMNQNLPFDASLVPEDFHQTDEDNELRERKRLKRSLSKDGRQEVLTSQTSNDRMGKKRRRLSSVSSEGSNSKVPTANRRTKRIASSKLSGT